MHHRLGILMLYDDSEQLEVRHVISLAHYSVDIYAGGDRIPEGELWIKRNCIRLTKRSESEMSSSDAKPFYLFSENCSEKEDFYHAVLQSQDHRGESPQSMPLPLKFDTPDLVRLVQQLHASEENMHTRWINALIGRIFLAMYKTEDVEKFIWNKITKKIARVPKPALIKSINLQKVEMGTLPPFVTNPKLRELTVDGDLTIEADVSYKGNFRVEISAIARIDLGSRFKARQVTLVLATTLKKLEGHILIRIKPPPSNRVWITFESPPKIELSLEPIVSSRQITYGVILRAMESRLREVVTETLVLPNWDDIPFKDTESSTFRGGIWTENEKTPTKAASNEEKLEQAVLDEEKSSDSEETDSSAPTLASAESVKSSRTPTVSSFDSADTQPTAYSTATDVRPSAKPKAMRSGSFAGAATPIVNVDSANASTTKLDLKDKQQDAASAMKTISMSSPTSPVQTPLGSPAQTSYMHRPRRSASSVGFEVAATPEEEDEMDDVERFLRGMPSAAPSLNLPSSAASQDSLEQLKTPQGSSTSLPRSSTLNSTDKRQIFNASLNNATAAAKKWFGKQNQNQNQNLSTSSPTSSPQPTPTSTPNLGTTSSKESLHEDESSILHIPASSNTSAPLGSPANPIGRGQPIPTVSVPVSGAAQNNKRNTTGWSVPTASAFASLARRKPVPQAGKTPSQSQNQNQNNPQFSFPEVHDPPDTDQPPPLPARTLTPSTPVQHFTPPTHSRKSSVGTAAMGVRRVKSSSITSLSAQPSPGRRPTTKRSVPAPEYALGGGWIGNGNEDGLLVVEAPTDASGLDSPAKGIFEEAVEGGVERRGSHGEGTVDTGMKEGDDGVTA
jgi:hypothetical protein